MKLILETAEINYYLTTSREYYKNKNEEELLVLQDRLGYLPDWVYTLSCAERLGIVQYDAEGHRVVVGNNHMINSDSVTLTRVTCRF